MHFTGFEPVDRNLNDIIHLSFNVLCPTGRKVFADYVHRICQIGTKQVQKCTLAYTITDFFYFLYHKIHEWVYTSLSTKIDNKIEVV